MKIWLDTALTNQAYYECDAECHECNECSHKERHTAQKKTPLSDAAMQHICTSVLELSTSLYWQEFAHAHWLVCNPIGSGRLVVLDSQAFLFLEQFRTPVSPQKVIQAYAEYPPGEIAGIVALFLSLGFLNSTKVRPSECIGNELQTLSAWLHITNACNLRCSYCYLQKTSEHMAEDTSRRAVEAVFRSARKHGFEKVRLRYAGGEASLHMARVLAVHEYATQLARDHAISLSASILSNGVVLSQRAIEHLKACKIGIMISLDGIGAYHDTQRPFINGQGSFKYVDRTISRLLTNDFPPTISVTVSERNLPGLFDLVAYILERDMPFALNYYRDNTFSTHLRDLQFGEEQMITTMRSIFKMIEQNLPRRRLLGSLIDKANLATPHNHTCGVGRNYLAIDQRGRIAKCHAEMAQVVTTIDADDPLQEIRNDGHGIQGLAVEEKEGCRTCQWRHWCTGGCPLLTYRMTGRNDIKSPNCHIYQALFPDVLRLEALRLLKYTSPIAL